MDLPPEKAVPDDPPPGIDDPYERTEVKPSVPVSQLVAAQHADPAPSVNQYSAPNDGLPSSLTGGDTVEQAQQLQGIGSEDFGKSSEPPLSPVSQALSKEMSQVSVDEVYDQANAVGQRQSRSYSRPFSADPNVRNHPAFKTSEPEQPNVDRAQLYSSESPLPSARRNPEEADRLRQPKGTEQYLSTQSKQEDRESEGTYRIPGPYIQNYRSPKQITTPRVGRSETQVEASGQPLPSTLRSQQQQLERQHQQYQSQQQYQQQLQQEQLYQQYERQQPQPQGPIQPLPQSQMMQEPGKPPFIPEQNRAQPDRQHYAGYMPTNPRQFSYEGDHTSKRLSQQPDQFAQRQQPSMGPPPAPKPQPASVNPPAVRKKSAFGSLFGGSSKSKLKKQERPPATIPENQDGTQKDKRASIFRRNSRHDSISSQQSGQYDGQDQLGQLPTWNTATHSGKRLSKNTMMPSGDEAREHPVEKEKEKKKRFSGLGSKLFKSGSTAKTPAAATSASTQPQMDARPPFQQQYSAQNYMSPQSTYGQYSGDAWTTQEQQPPAQFQRGYSHSSQQQQQQETQPEYPGSPQQQYSQPQRAYTQPIQQGTPDSHYDYSTPPVSQPVSHAESHYPTTTSPFQYSSGIAGGTYPSMQANQSSFNPQPGGYPSNTVPYINPDQRRPSDLRIDTNTPNRSSQNIPATAPAQVYPNRETQFSPPPPGSVEARQYGAPSPRFTTTTAPTSAAGSGTNPGAGRNHVFDLHKRSRSPKLGRRNSSEDFDAQRRRDQENGLAATGLGTFISKRISPVGGVPRPESDQERPYAIDLPGLDEDADQSQAGGHKRNRTMSPIPQTIQENTLGAATAAARSGTPVSLDSSAKDSGAAGVPSGGTGTYSRAVHSGAMDGLVSRSSTTAAPPTGKAIARDKSVGGTAVELPGSKPDGYESEEEVVMTATAYPGQEWMPTFVGDGRWDD